MKETRHIIYLMLCEGIVNTQEQNFIFLLQVNHWHGHKYGMQGDFPWAALQHDWDIQPPTHPNNIKTNYTETEDWRVTNVLANSPILD